MDSGKTTASRRSWLAQRDGADRQRPVPALVIVWSASEPSRVGEVALLRVEGDRLLGRGPARADDPYARLRFARQRPGRFDVTGPLEGPRLSRHQLRLRASAGAVDVEVERLGRCELRIGDVRTDKGVLRTGGTLTLEDEIVLLLTERPEELLPSSVSEAFPFGEADENGIVGESAAVWRLRAEVAALAGRPAHVLVLGESGVGKELVARALHNLSDRARGPLVARNAATLPSTLADAELFGHAKNFPNAGMPERAGLLGEAEGGTLFLDEIGELPAELQAHLLRLLDSGGEYHRLGDAATRRADVRVVAATNRPEASLKHDFAARFPLKLHVPGLGERSEDVPLLLRHLLRTAAARDAALGERFFDGWGGGAPEPRIAPRLVERLLRHGYTRHVRELESLLWAAVSESRERYIGLGRELEEQLAAASPSEAAARPQDLTREEIVMALEANGGNQERAFRALGLRSRDALYRLIKKHGIRVRKDPDEG